MFTVFSQLTCIFQYMPIGRSFTLDLMPTPEQRAWMWRRSWQIIRERRFFIPDFWNGAVTPCVFMPYSPVNIRDAYAQGKTLNDVWQGPFFHALRQW